MVWAFAALMAAHWLEHAFQAWQVYVMHMPRACALGMLGMRYPWLIRTESLHFGFAVFTTVGLLLLWNLFAAPMMRLTSTVPGLTGRVVVGGLVGYKPFIGDMDAKGDVRPVTARWWKAATSISIWHLFEHTLLFGQATLHHNLFGSPVPTSIIQLIVPRIELHLFYNSLVTVPVAVAMLLILKRDSKAVTSLVTAS
jgi:hypothetical protein